MLIFLLYNKAATGDVCVGQLYLINKMYIFVQVHCVLIFYINMSFFVLFLHPYTPLIKMCNDDREMQLLWELNCMRWIAAKLLKSSS